MYIPKHYQNNNQEALIAFIKAHPFGILVTQGESAPWATHLPFMLRGDAQSGFHLVGHLSKANPQWKAFANQKEVLVVFNGPQHYISASWYKEEEVPTWDYIAIHAYGPITIMNDEELITALHQLVNHHEKGEKKPLDLSKMSLQTLEQYKGVIGFSIAVNKLEGAYKLSQTRKEDHSNIATELLEKESFQATEIAKAIQREVKKNKQ
jgi:transcriptional regulator